VASAVVACGVLALSASAAEASGPAAWSVEATPNPVGATDSVLSGVSCSSAAVCIAVGHFTSRAGAGVLLAERYDGNRWSTESIRKPLGARTSLLFDVSCASPAACTAVGSVTDRSGLTVPLVERRNRSRWKVQRTPDLSSSSHGVSYLGGVSCASSRDCVAVGFSGNATGTVGTPLAERWNGAGWRVQQTPLPTGARVGSLSGVSCTSARSCIAVGFFVNRVGAGEPLAERWNGTRWSIEPVPSPVVAAYQLVGVSCSRQGSCMAAGFFVVTGIEVMLAERRNGRRWSTQRALYPAGATGVQFAGASCPSSSACTAVGSFGDISGFDEPLAERWDGTSWAIEPIASPAGAVSASLSAVSCSSTTTCMAVGTLVSRTGKEITLAERYS
jgi:hypothetical protein